jgi:hypothetical protein
MASYPQIVQNMGITPGSLALFVEDPLVLYWESIQHGNEKNACRQAER